MDDDLDSEAADLARERAVADQNGAFYEEMGRNFAAYRRSLVAGGVPAATANAMVRDCADEFWGGIFGQVGAET